MPKFLHRDLYLEAKENDVSLNQHITYLLTKSITLESVLKKTEELSAKTDQHPNIVSQLPRADMIDWKGNPSQSVSEGWHSDFVLIVLICPNVCSPLTDR